MLDAAFIAIIALFFGFALVFAASLDKLRMSKRDD